MQLILKAKDKKEIEIVQKESEAVLEKVQEIAAVTDASTEARAAEYLKQLKDLYKAVDEKRKRLVKPLNDHVDMINDDFKKTLVPLKAAQEMISTGMTAYRNSEEFKAAEAKRKQIEDEAREAVAAGDVHTLQELQPVHAEALSAAPRIVSTDSGKTHYRKYWLFEITDIEALPAEFWMPDEKKIQSRIESGVAIPGIRAWSEERPVSR